MFRNSKGSVATCSRHGGIFKHDFVANLQLSLTVKKFENRLTFNEIIGKSFLSCFFLSHIVVLGGSVAEWLACWTKAQKGPGSNRCWVTVLGKLFTPIVPLFTKQQTLVAALLRVAGVTAGLAESNGSLPLGL